MTREEAAKWLAEVLVGLTHTSDEPCRQDCMERYVDNILALTAPDIANPSVPTRDGGGGEASACQSTLSGSPATECTRPPMPTVATPVTTGPGPLTPTCATCGYGCHRGQERRLRDVLVCRACACPSCRPATKGGFEEALHQERAEHERTEIARCAGLQRERDLEAEIARINVRLDCGHRKVDCVDANGGCAFCGWSPRFGYSGDVYRLLREARGQLSIAKADRDAAVEAAREMRDHLVCDTSCSRECPRGDCECEGCVDARAFDAALAKLEVKP